MIAVVIGPTGLVGSNIVRLLLAQPLITRVVSVSRKSTRVDHPKLKEILITDLTDLPRLQSDLRGDIYFCSLGTTLRDAGSQHRFRQVDYDGVLAFGRIAKAHKARGFALVSSAGAHPHSRLFYSRVKGEAERDLEALHLQRLLIFRPALLLGSRSSFRLAEWLFVSGFEGLRPLLPKGLQKRLATNAVVLAERMVAEMLSGPAPVGVQVVEAKNI